MQQLQSETLNELVVKHLNIISNLLKKLIKAQILTTEIFVFSYFRNDQNVKINKSTTEH